MPKQAADQPEVLLTQEAQVAVVDVEIKVVAVAVERNDLALGVGRHPLEEDPLVVFQGFDPLLLRLTGELHLMELNNVLSVNMASGFSFTSYIATVNHAYHLLEFLYKY